MTPNLARSPDDTLAAARPIVDCPGRLIPRMLSRRELLRQSAAMSSALALGQIARLAAAAPPPTSAPASRPAAGSLPTRVFGGTGRPVTMLAIGTGMAVQGRSFDEVVDVLNHAIERGVRYIDTAPSYEAEEQVGKAIATRRDELFVATKTLARGYDGAMRELEASLRKLGADRLDLWQVHSIGHDRETPEQAIERLRDRDGVMKAMRKMRDEKVTSFIGFTGHTSPEHMLRVLACNDLDFDTMLFTISAALRDGDRQGWEDKVLPAGRERRLGLIAMKVFGGGALVGAGRRDENRLSPAELLSYVWDRGVPVANVGLYSTSQVDEAVRALKAYDTKSASVQHSPTAGADMRLASASSLALPYESPDYVDVTRSKS